MALSQMAGTTPEPYRNTPIVYVTFSFYVRGRLRGERVRFDAR